MNKFLKDDSLFVDYISQNNSNYNKFDDEIYICFERGKYLFPL